VSAFFLPDAGLARPWLSRPASFLAGSAASRNRLRSRNVRPIKLVVRLVIRLAAATGGRDPRRYNLRIGEVHVFIAQESRDAEAGRSAPGPAGTYSNRQHPFREWPPAPAALAGRSRN